ncbi:MAG: Hpt domain-containing protein [Spirochaetales bacterium]|nr:Hpt domain-containing protein [Spirochaetales bacterium]
MSQLGQLEHFLKDSKEFLEQLNALFLLFETGTVSKDTLEEAFRCFHSIKSEAAYLDLDDISTLAHEGEGLLGSLRQSGMKRDSRLLDRLFTITSGIESALKQVVLPEKEPGEADTPGSLTRGRYQEIKGTGFSPQDRELLQEARNRNENLYRAECCFLDGLPMVYPRAFLILNKLEQLVTVIKTIPELYQKQEDFAELTVFFTAPLLDSRIREIFNVDGIDRAYFARVPWNLVFRVKAQDNSLPVMETVSAQIRSVSIPVSELDMMLGDLHSLKMTVFQEHPYVRDELEKVEKNLKRFRLVPLSQEFNRYTVFVRNTSRDLGKEAEVQVSGGEIQVDKNILEQLSDPIMQLVRNALVHGIEMPTEREERGKPSKGTITLSAELKGKSLVIRVSDNGRGIDEDRIRDLAKKTGLFSRTLDDLSLIDLLSTQGFTSAPQVSGYAGRGIGLDLVVQKIHTLPGAEFSLSNNPGEGVCFTLEIPHAVSLAGVHLFAYSKKLFAVLSDNLKEPGRLDPALIERKGEGGIVYKGKPVYTIYGRLFLLDTMPEPGVVIPMFIDGEEVFVIADEDVAIEDLPRDKLHILETNLPGLYDVHIGERKVPYVLFDPDRNT